MDCQRTVAKPVGCRGVGLHTGTPVSLRLLPAPPDHGVVFRVLPEGIDIPARPDFLINGHYATTIGRDGVELQTVEHLLAATGSLGIDNLLVEVDARELPAMDGSAAPFVSLLYAGEPEEQPAPRQPLHVAEPVRVGDDARWIQVVPGPELRISYTLDLDHPAVGMQTVTIEPTELRFVEEIASARTYGFLRDLELLRRQGLARGGSLDNAVVVGEERVLNASLRFRDEFVRHKILDLIGDLALLGRPVIGDVIARNAGHTLHHRLVREIAGSARGDAERARSLEAGQPAVAAR
jgi:UDP-3-O-[3-hydroxymyristoyl] N-acetylglucosamine deacetylase